MDETVRAARGGRADVVYVLLLVQVGAGLLAMLGELLFMGGNPLYALAPVTKAAVTLVFAALLVRGRRGALVAVAALQLLTLTGFALSALAGALPQLDFTPTLTGLITGLVLPVAVTMTCVRLLIEPEPEPAVPVGPAGAAVLPLAGPPAIAGPATAPGVVR
ncbi:hypothetical protein [Catellatospora paridis]|uniref:hypothetical protein n=1 Tax=Catellatospora paridis TaxID=1617086 RepID=UPI0012D3DCC0|nr:hypothetical protein [Catellatospora paridis]